jgi:hypothetical protein
VTQQAHRSAPPGTDAPGGAGETVLSDQNDMNPLGRLRNVPNAGKGIIPRGMKADVKLLYYFSSIGQ